MKNKRVLWLLNHETLSKFELPLLVELGFEVFTPKTVDSSVIEWSGSITYDYDKTLSLEQEVIDRLNTINFYKDGIDKETINLINEHFDIALCMFNIEVIKFLAKDFEGKIFIRAFGLDKDRAYYSTLEEFLPKGMLNRINQIKDRVWFSQCYENLSDIEKGLFKDNAVYMPLGLPEEFYRIADTWKGTKNKILFFCSRIGVSPYYKNVYEEFKRDFKGFDYSIAGNQPIEINDPNVLGFLKREEVDDLFKEYKVMFYHSQEPRHLHYHPLEAMIAGMPVIYMQEGMLEALAENDEQPGRAKNIQEARQKVRRILENDQVFINQVIEAQRKIIYKFSKQYNLDMWKQNFMPLLISEECYSSLNKTKATTMGAFILNDSDEKNIRKYIGDLLVINNALKMINSENQLILGVTESIYRYFKLELSWVFSENITIRQVDINYIPYETVDIINNFNFDESKFAGNSYIIPDDKMKNFIDLDVWIFMGSECELPIAPVKPYWIYCDSMNMRSLNHINIRNMKNAQAIFVNNPYDSSVLIHGLGINDKKIYQLPYTYYTSEEVINITKNDEQYHLIICKDILFDKNDYDILEILDRKYRYGQLKEKVKILTDKSMVENLRGLIKTNKTIKKNIIAIDAIDEFDYINTIRNAISVIVYPTSSNITMDIITAIQFNKCIYSIKNPTIEYIQAYFNYEIKDYCDILNSKKITHTIEKKEHKVNSIDMKVLNDETKVVLEKLL